MSTVILRLDNVGHNRNVKIFWVLLEQQQFNSSDPDVWSTWDQSSLNWSQSSVLTLVFLMFDQDIV